MRKSLFSAIVALLSQVTAIATLFIRLVSMITEEVGAEASISLVFLSANPS